MDNLFNLLMQRGMKAPPTQAVGMWSQYQPPPPNRPPGWTAGPQQNKQAVGPGPGAATPPGPMNRG